MMSSLRTYRSFIHKKAVLRVCCSCYDSVVAEIIEQRCLLEAYIEQHRQFQSSLTPVELFPNAPVVARRMAYAASLVGTGPMAAVAGIMAQLAAEAGLKAGAEEAIVENGGDIFLKTISPVVIGFYSGENEAFNRLAFLVQPEETPMAICSSSGKMGHSLSLGCCDLATVVAKDAALADAAATMAANGVSSPADIEPALNRIAAIPGVAGVLIIQEGQIGLAGQLPDLIRPA